MWMCALYVPGSENESDTNCGGVSAIDAIEHAINSRDSGAVDISEVCSDLYNSAIGEWVQRSAVHVVVAENTRDF